MKVPDICIINLERLLDKFKKKEGLDAIDCASDIIDAARAVVDEAVEEDV